MAEWPVSATVYLRMSAVSSSGLEGEKRPPTAGKRSMLPLRESNRFRGFPFELDRLRCSGLEVTRRFAAVLIAALVDDFLHFRGRAFRKWERPTRHVVALRANGDLRAIRVHHEAFELIKSSLLRLWLHRSDDNGCSGISNDDRDGRRTLRRRRRRRKDARRRKHQR